MAVILIFQHALDALKATLLNQIQPNLAISSVMNAQCSLRTAPSVNPPLIVKFATTAITSLITGQPVLSNLNFAKLSHSFMQTTENNFTARNACLDSTLTLKSLNVYPAQTLVKPAQILMYAQSVI